MKYCEDGPRTNSLRIISKYFTVGLIWIIKSLDLSSFQREPGMGWLPYGSPPLPFFFFSGFPEVSSLGFPEVSSLPV
uniref:Uncharacterized protein n=1 Tax=Nelumbo nucifera TaxID=4432 RepID=A0A822XMP0_NELNU|nr:TPA_asm: hypothetical protein HUJ06_021792 [Nelumbo nucifera]